MIRVLVVISIVLASATAWAHKPSDAQLRLAAHGDTVDGALVLDVDGDGTITWGEITGSSPAIAAYVGDRVKLSTTGPCETTLGTAALVDLSDGAYLSLPIDATCPGEVGALTIDYRLLFDVDAQHRGLVTFDGTTEIVRDGSPVRIERGETTSMLGFVWEGVWHIWIGFDHILFLLCLVIPAVVFDPDQRGLHDRAAETILVRTR